MRGVLEPVRGITVPDEGAAVLDRLVAAQRHLRRGREARAAFRALIDGDPAAFASIFPDEGITYNLNVFPLTTQAVPTTLYLGMFSSQTAGTVPARDAVLATQTGVAELTNAGGYARAAVPAASWPAPAQNGTGMRTSMVAPGISFATSSGAYNAAANGFFVATASGIGAGVALYYTNWADGIAVTVNAAGFTVRVPAYWQENGS